LLHDGGGQDEGLAGADAVRQVGVAGEQDARDGALLGQIKFDIRLASGSVR
jgi:hypothetical protein